MSTKREIQVTEVALQEEEEDGVRAVCISGFDPESGWDPTVTLLKDGTVDINFPEFPPDHLAEAFDDFDARMATAIGFDVYWEDRELFHVENGGEPAFAAVVKFLTENGG
jgi:hypothetical protein